MIIMFCSYSPNTVQQYMHTSSDKPLRVRQLRLTCLDEMRIPLPVTPCIYIHIRIVLRLMCHMCTLEIEEMLSEVEEGLSEVQEGLSGVQEGLSGVAEGLG